VAVTVSPAVDGGNSSGNVAAGAVEFGVAAGSGRHPEHTVTSDSCVFLSAADITESVELDEALRSVLNAVTVEDFGVRTRKYLVFDDESGFAFAVDGIDGERASKSNEEDGDEAKVS
jgi:hypothetical protein